MNTPMPIADQEAAEFTGRIIVVLAARNEGIEVVRTVRAFRGDKAPGTVLFFSVVDDGSDDGCCRVLNRAEDISCVRNESPCSQAAARNLGALRFIDEQPDCFVFMDAHERPASTHCLEHLALAAIRTGSVVCPICKNFDREKDFNGAGGCLAWYPIKDPKSRQGPGLRVEWAYEQDHEFEPVGTVYGGCYAMTPATFQTLGGFLDTAGVYGYAEAALGLNAYFQGMHRWCYTKAVVRHLFRKQRPYPGSGIWYWRNYVYCNRILWSDDAFRTHFLPVAKANCADPMLDFFAASPWVADQRDKFAERKVGQHENGESCTEEDCLRWLGVIGSARSDASGTMALDDDEDGTGTSHCDEQTQPSPPTEGEGSNAALEGIS